MTTQRRRTTFVRPDMPIGEQVLIVCIVAAFAIFAGCLILGSVLTQAGWQ